MKNMQGADAMSYIGQTRTRSRTYTIYGHVDNLLDLYDGTRRETGYG